MTNVELDHHATYASRLDLEDAFAQFLALAPRRIVWDRPDLVALAMDAGDAEVVTFDAPEADLRPDGVALSTGAATTSRSPCPAPTTRSTPPRPSRPAAPPAPTSTAPSPRWPTSAAPAGASSSSAPPRPAPPSTTTTPTTRPRSRPLSPPRARSSPPAWSPSSNPTSTRGRAACTASSAPRWRAPTSSRVLDVYPARERAEDFPGVTGRLVAAAAADAAGGRPVYWLPDFATAEPVLRGLLRAGDLCLVMGAGDIDALGRNLVAAR